MALSKKEQKVFQVILFRKNMGAEMPKEKVFFFWGKGFGNLLKKEKGKDFEKKKLIKRKVNVVKKNIKRLLFLDWVKFIAVTGSVAAGVPKKEDDIDVFIVVKNNRIWLYRAILTLKMGLLRRVWGRPFKDKVDTNFICEERGLWFNTGSIFILHELLFMVPVYNKRYYENILNINFQLLEKFGIERNQEDLNLSQNYFLEIFNKLAFCLQYVYMILKRHNPNLKRLKRNNKMGRIAFFPEDFRKRKVKEFEKVLNQA